MNRIVLAAAALLAVPAQSIAATDRDRGFAICLTITPGLGAASLGYPGRGAATFSLNVAGGALLGSGLARRDQGRITAGGAMIVGSYVWAFFDGTTLEPRGDYTPPPVNNWRPAGSSARPDATTAPFIPDHLKPKPEVFEPRPMREEPSPRPMATPKPHVPDPSGKAFIRTQRAGLQEVIVGTVASATLMDGTKVVGKILEVSDVAIVIDMDGTAVTIRGEELAQVYRR